MNHATILYPFEEVLQENYINALKTEFVRQVKLRSVPQSKYETFFDDDVLISRLYVRIKTN